MINLKPLSVGWAVFCVFRLKKANENLNMWKNVRNGVDNETSACYNVRMLVKYSINTIRCTQDAGV